MEGVTDGLLVISGILGNWKTEKMKGLYNQLEDKIVLCRQLKEEVLLAISEEDDVSYGE